MRYLFFPRAWRGGTLPPRMFPEAQGRGRGIAPRRIPPFTSYLLPFTSPRHKSGGALPPLFSAPLHCCVGKNGRCAQIDNNRENDDAPPIVVYRLFPIAV